MGEELSAGRLGDLVKEYNKSIPDSAAHVKQRGASSIDLPPSLMVSFFKPLFDNIKQKVTSLANQALAKESPVNFIFMVGGFSESPFLKAEVKKQFEEGMGISVLVPRRP